MTPLRRHIITGDPVLYAPHRAGRPNAYGTLDGLPCPFCPVYETETPPEIVRVGSEDRWQVRVFPNKYPTAEHHEVIVEAPGHQVSFDEIEHAPEVVRIYADRFRGIAGRAGVEYVSLSKNQGAGGGASIPHLHSQILGVPFLPPRIAREAAAFRAAARCPLCTVSEPAAVTLMEGEHFIWMAPSPSSFPHQQWILPRRHQPEPRSITEGETNELATLLQSAAAGMRTISPSYNWMFMTFPGAAAAHWYIDIVPRLATIAGFELQTGATIQLTEALDTAALVRRP